MTGVAVDEGELLSLALEASVYLWVSVLRMKSMAEVLDLARESAQVVAEKGDVILFRSKKKGETAAALNALARGLAALSFMPGGVTFLGVHYQNNHTGEP